LELVSLKNKPSKKMLGCVKMTLPNTAEVDECIIHLLKRIGDVVIVANFTGNHFQGYEVHSIRDDCYCNADQFGIDAWSYNDLFDVITDFPQFEQYEAEINNLVTKLKQDNTPKMLHELLELLKFFRAVRE